MYSNKQGKEITLSIRFMSLTKFKFVYHIHIIQYERELTFSTGGLAKDRRQILQVLVLLVSLLPLFLLELGEADMWRLLLRLLARSRSGSSRSGWFLFALLLDELAVAFWAVTCNNEFRGCHIKNWSRTKKTVVASKS